VDVRALAFAMPGALGHVEQQRLVLRVRALRYVSAAAPLLTAWFSALRNAYDYWLEDGEKARLTRNNVLCAAGGDEDLALQVSKLLLRERWAFGSGHGLPEDRDWWAEIISEVRLVSAAGNAEELLEVRDQREYPSGEAGRGEEQVEQPPPDHIPAWRHLWDWAVEHYIGAVLAGLTVLLVATIIGVLVSSLASGGDESSSSAEPPARDSSEGTSPEETTPPTGPGNLEEAGEGGARTYRDPFDLSQTGRSVSPFQQVRVQCRVHAPTLPSVTPDGNWYRLLSPPWNGNYYAPTNSFWNGDTPGQTPYTHNTDFDVPECSKTSDEQG
jgi:hypothetical protein